MVYRVHPYYIRDEQLLQRLEITSGTYRVECMQSRLVTDQNKSLLSYHFQNPIDRQGVPALT